MTTIYIEYGTLRVSRHGAICDDELHTAAAACQELESIDGKPSLRSIAAKHGVPRTTLHRVSKGPATPSGILERTGRRGSRQRLTRYEERILAETIGEFQQQGTPLMRSLVLDVAETYIKTLPENRRCRMPFVNCRPGVKWLLGFLSHYPNLVVKTTIAIENERARAMSPDFVAQHFARIRLLLDEHNITEPTDVFNIDECVFSVKEMTWGRLLKRVVEAGSVVFQMTLACKGSDDHVSCMPVVNAAGQAFTPAFVLPRVRARFRRCAYGHWETPADFLLPLPNIFSCVM